MATAAASSIPARRGEERADLSAWLAVAAGSLGAMMATLDTSIVIERQTGDAILTGVEAVVALPSSAR